MLTRSRIAIAVAGICLATPAAAWEEGERTGYASINGLEMYYEIHGTGRLLSGDRRLKLQSAAAGIFLGTVALS